jgi:hypothetical protein
MHHHPTPTHYIPSPFHTARMKLSHNGTVSYFFTQTPSRPCISQTHQPPTTTTSCTPPSHPYAPSSIAVPHGAHETEPQWHGFVFFTQTPSLPRISQTHQPPTTTTSCTPPSHPYAPSSTAVSHGVPKTEPKRLGFIFFTQTPSRALRFTNAPPHCHLLFIYTTPPHPRIPASPSTTIPNDTPEIGPCFGFFSPRPLPDLASHKRTTP